MRSIALAAIVALNAGHLFGDEFFSAGHSLYLDHLVPVRSFMDDFSTDSDHLLAEYLFVTDGKLGRMLVRPSFSPEFCLSVDVEHIEHPAEKTTHRHRQQIPSLPIPILPDPRNSVCRR